jgi:hypothetical protein
MDGGSAAIAGCKSRPRAQTVPRGPLHANRSLSATSRRAPAESLALAASLALATHFFSSYSFQIERRIAQPSR